MLGTLVDSSGDQHGPCHALAGRRHTCPIGCGQGGGGQALFERRVLGENVGATGQSPDKEIARSACNKQAGTDRPALITFVWSAAKAARANASARTITLGT